MLVISGQVGRFQGPARVLPFVDDGDEGQDLPILTRQSGRRSKRVAVRACIVGGAHLGLHDQSGRFHTRDDAVIRVDQVIFAYGLASGLVAAFRWDGPILTASI